TPDGKTLVSGGWSQTVRLWDAATGKEQRRFATERYIDSLAISPDGRTVACALRDAGVRLYQISTGDLALIAEPSGHSDSVAFSPDGRTLAASWGPNGEGILTWTVSSGQPVHKLDAGRERTSYAVCFSPNGRVIAGASLDGIYLWDAVTGWPIRRLADQTHL